MAEHALYFEHEVTYTNKEPLPVADVVDALLALERISKRFLPRTINALADVDVESAELLVLGFEHGSLKEKLLIKFLFRNEKDFDAFLGKLSEGKFGEAFRDAYKNMPGNRRMKVTTIGMALTTLIAFGIGHMVANESAQTHVNNVLIIGAESYQRDPEAFADIVRATVGTDNKKLAQDVARFVAPAKDDSNGTIEVDGNASLALPRDVVESVPREFNPEPVESNIEYKDVIVEIRATDRDSSKKGWSGIVKNLFDKRVTMELAEGVDATALSKRMQVRADVHVISRPGKQHKMEPKRIVIDRVLSGPVD